MHIYNYTHSIFLHCTSKCSVTHLFNIAQLYIHIFLIHICIFLQKSYNIVSHSLLFRSHIYYFLKIILFPCKIRYIILNIAHLYIHTFLNSFTLSVFLRITCYFYPRFTYSHHIRQPLYIFC